MCYFCNKNDALDIGWLERNGEFYSCCYDCGLKEEGEYCDAISSGAVKHGAKNPKPLTQAQEAAIIRAMKQWCMICGKEVTEVKNYPYDFYCSKECEQKDNKIIAKLVEAYND